MDVRPYRIEPANARQAIESGQAVVVDVTSPIVAQAVRGRIPGAVWVSPREALDPNRRSADLVRSLDLPRDKTVIAYCTCADETGTERLIRALRRQGYDAWLLDGGLPAWRAAGYPMEANLIAA